MFECGGGSVEIGYLITHLEDMRIDAVEMQNDLLPGSGNQVWNIADSRLLAVGQDPGKGIITQSGAYFLDFF